MTEASSTPPVATSPVVTNVFDELLVAVHTGRLRPGQRISDHAIAQEYGVSRTPVREALVRLRELGVVEASANRFTRVAVVDSEQTAQALIVWVALLGAVIDEVLPGAPPELGDRLEQLRQEAESGPDAATAAFRFTDELVQCSQNAELQRTIAGAAHVVHLGSEHLSELVGAAAIAHARRELVAAVRAQDPSAAHRALEPYRSAEVRDR